LIPTSATFTAARGWNLHRRASNSRWEQAHCRSGNFKIENNHLEGAAETILFGGVLKNSATPGDITIRRNDLFKPLIWMPGQPGFVGGLNAIRRSAAMGLPANARSSSRISLN
jgi:hypothetical protein